MAESYVLINDQANGKAIATAVSLRLDNNGNNKHIQLQAAAARPLEMFNVTRYASYKDTSLELVEQMKNTVFDLAAVYGITPHPFQSICYMGAANTVTGLDEAYIIGGADNRCHMLELSAPLNPVVTLDYFPALPVEIGNEIAATHRYSASIYVLGKTGRICSRLTNDTSAPWTLYAIEWGTFNKSCSLVRSRDVASGNRWFVLQRGAYEEIKTASDLNQSIPDVWNQFSFGEGGSWTGAVLHWCRYYHELLLFDFKERQAYTWKSIPQNNFEGWSPLGNLFNYDCSEWGGIEEIDNTLFVFTGMGDGCSYSRMDISPNYPEWFSTQSGGYLESMMNPFFSGTVCGGSPVGDDGYLILSGGYANQGIDVNPSLQVLLKSRPGLLDAMLDCLDMTTVKSILRALSVTTATAVTFTPILFDQSRQPIFILPPITIEKPAQPLMSAHNYEIWGCSEWDVRGAAYCGLYINMVTPGDETNGNIEISMSAI